MGVLGLTKHATNGSSTELVAMYKSDVKQALPI